MKPLASYHSRFSVEKKDWKWTDKTRKLKSCLNGGVIVILYFPSYCRIRNTKGYSNGVCFELPMILNAMTLLGRHFN